MAFIRITGNQQLDFQINRVLTYGSEACDMQEVILAMKDVKDLKTWFWTWNDMALKAEIEKRYLHAAYYFRMAEFYLSEKDEYKNMLYDLSIRNFRRVIEKDKGVSEVFVPYQNAEMKVLVFTPENPIDTIVMFGGYDSFIEEFYLAVKDVVKKGYKVILFEGPGQGLSLKKGIHFDHRWELPLAAVLDYFRLEAATLVGISWGGYFALRAAAYEKRVSRAVAYDVLYNGLDFMLKQFPFAFKIIFITLFTLKQGAIINYMMRWLMRKKLAIDWALTHGMYITGTDSPYNYFKKLKKHSLKKITSKITAHILLLAGHNDHYIPLKHYHLLMKKLINARSLQGKIFSKEEGGEQHCQIGNHSLAINQIVSWIENTDLANFKP